MLGSLARAASLGALGSALLLIAPGYAFAGGEVGETAVKTAAPGTTGSSTTERNSPTAKESKSPVAERLGSERAASEKTGRERSGGEKPLREDGKAAPRELLREGTKLADEVGFFRLTGDRAVFFYGPGNAQQLNALENLALERVALVVGETPDQLQWSISGTVTEYRGSNYLLITKALIKRKVAPSGGSPPAAAPRAVQPSTPSPRASLPRTALER